MKSLLILLLLTLSLEHNPVYNVHESDPSKDPNRPLVPQLTTNYESMLVDRTKRVITLGENQKSENSVEFSPIRQYDQDVEFFSDKKPKSKILIQQFDDKELRAKETQIEQMIYSLYELQSEEDRKQFLKGEESPLQQFLIIIGNANHPLLLQEIHILDQVRELIKYLRKQEESLKLTNNREALEFVSIKVKTLSFLLDQRDFQQKVVESLDTDLFTYNRTMQQLDSPLKYYANRVSFLIKKGQFLTYNREVFDQAAFSDIANFGFFAQRKSKLQMIFRKMSIIRAKNMTGDIEGQQNAIINLLEELQNELRNCQEGLIPLSQFQNQMALIAPLENVEKITQVMNNCLAYLNNFPEIQFICKEIQQTHAFSKTNSFKKLSFLIKQEIAEYEHSISSLVIQIQLGRAAQDAVNLRYVPNVYQNLNRMATECQNNQKKISANEKITNYILTINVFRQSDQSVVLALQNIDNVLFETNKGTFWNAHEAQSKEFTNSNDHLSLKLNSQRMIIDKLVEAAGKMAIETTPENSHQAEILVEDMVLFQQRHDKLNKISKYLSRNRTNQIKSLLDQETQQLKLRQEHTNVILSRLVSLETSVFQNDIKSAQEITQSLMKERELRASARLRLAQAYGQFIINERRVGAGYLQQAHQEIDLYLQSIIASLQDVSLQHSLLDKIFSQESVNGNIEQQIKSITDKTQDVVIVDNGLEDFLLQIRCLLLDGKGVEAKNKILLFVNRDENQKHSNDFTIDDIHKMFVQTLQDFEEDDYELANRHSEQLVDMIQHAEKQADILYTIRAVITFKNDGKQNALGQAVEDLKVSIQKEFFSIENKQKIIKKLQQLVNSLLNKNVSNQDFSKELYEIRSQAYLNNRYYDLSKLCISLSTNNDNEGAQSSLHDLSQLLERDISDLELSKSLVDEQQQLLSENKNSDSISTQHQLEKVQQLSRQQIIVMTDDSLNQSHQQFVAFRNEKDHLKSIDALKAIEEKGVQYLQLVEQKMLDLKNTNEPNQVIKSVINMQATKKSKRVFKRKGTK